MTLLGDVFPKLQTPKKVVIWMSEKSRSGRPLNKQHGKRSETLLQPVRRHPYHIY